MAFYAVVIAAQQTKTPIKSFVTEYEKSIDMGSNSILKLKP